MDVILNQNGSRYRKVATRDRQAGAAADSRGAVSSEVTASSRAGKHYHLRDSQSPRAGEWEKRSKDAQPVRSGRCCLQPAGGVVMLASNHVPRERPVHPEGTYVLVLVSRRGMMPTENIRTYKIAQPASSLG